MRAADVMRPSFATVKPNTQLIDVARLLLETNQRGLPVLDVDGRLAGIVAEGDLLHRDEFGVSPPGTGSRHFWVSRRGDLSENECERFASPTS